MVFRKLKDRYNNGIIKTYYSASEGELDANYKQLIFNSNPWGYWNLDETSGTVAYDSTNNANNGSYNNCSLNQTGVFNKCVFFNGANSSVTINKNITTAPNQLTLECIFKTNVLNGGLISYNSSNGWDREIYIENGRLNFYIYGGGSISSTNSYSNNLWHIVTAKLTATVGTKLFVDKILVASSNNGNSPDYSANWHIGRSRQMNTWFNGLIDEVSIKHTPDTDNDIIKRHEIAMVNF